MPPKRKAPSDAAPPVTKNTRQRVASPTPEVPSIRRALRSRGAAPSVEAAPQPPVEEPAPRKTRATRQKKVAETNEATVTTEEAPAPVPAPAPKRTTRSRAAPAPAPEEAQPSAEASGQLPLPAATRPKRGAKKQAIPPSDRVTRSRSNSVTSIQSNDDNTVEPTKPVEYSGPRSRTRSKTKVEETDGGNAEPTTTTQAPKRATRSRKIVEPVPEPEVEDVRPKRARAKAPSRAPETKRRRGRSAKEADDVVPEPEEAQNEEAPIPESNTVNEILTEIVDKVEVEAEAEAEAEDVVMENAESAIPDMPANDAALISALESTTIAQPVSPPPSVTFNTTLEPTVEVSHISQENVKPTATISEAVAEESKEDEPITEPLPESIPEITPETLTFNAHVPPTNDDEEMAETAVESVAAESTVEAINATETIETIPQAVTPDDQEVNEPSLQLFQEQSLYASQDATEANRSVEPVAEVKEDLEVEVEAEVEAEVETANAESEANVIDEPIQSQEELSNTEDKGDVKDMEMTEHATECSMESNEQVDKDDTQEEVLPAVSENDAAVDESVAIAISIIEDSPLTTDVEPNTPTQDASPDPIQEAKDAVDEVAATNQGSDTTVEQSLTVDQGMTAASESIIAPTEEESGTTVTEDSVTAMEETQNITQENSVVAEEFQISVDDFDFHEDIKLNGPTEVAPQHETEPSEQGVLSVREEEDFTVSTESELDDEVAEESMHDAEIDEQKENTPPVEEILAGRTGPEVVEADTGEQGVQEARIDEEVVLTELPESVDEAEVSMHYAQTSEQGVHEARVEDDFAMVQGIEGGSPYGAAAGNVAGHGFYVTQEEGFIAIHGSEQGVHFAHEESFTFENSEQGVQYAHEEAEYELVDPQEDDTVILAQDSDVDMMDVDPEYLVEDQQEGSPERRDSVGGSGWTSPVVNSSPLAPLSQAAINAGHSGQAVTSEQDAGSSAGAMTPQTPPRSFYGPWGYLRHQPRVSSPLKTFAETLQCSPTEELPARGRRVSENGIPSRSGDPSPLRSDELSKRDFTSPVGSPSQLSPRILSTPGSRKRSRSRSVRGSSPLKNAVEFSAPDAGDEAESSTRASSRMAGPLARLASDYDPNQDISELREEEVPMTPGAEQPLGNILDEVAEEQLSIVDTAAEVTSPDLPTLPPSSSDDGNDEVGSSPRPSQGLDGSDDSPRRSRRRSRLPIPKAAEKPSASPLSARLKRVSQTKSLSDRELSKVTARNTTRNGVYKNATFERKVVRIPRQRPPSPTRDTQTAAAEEARLIRQLVFERTGVALGPGDDEDYVPPQVSPSDKRVKWHEKLEHELKEDEKSKFQTEKGILAPERVRRDSSTVHEITIQKILYEGEKDVLDEEFEEA